MTDYDYEMKEEVEISPLPDVILVYGMESGEKKTKAGLIIPDDNGTERGIRPRTGIVYALGENIDYLEVGDTILVSHGRWTRGIKVKQANGEVQVIRRVDPKDVLLVY
jgi:co-chaperonin GroES (HSP10)